MEYWKLNSIMGLFQLLSLSSFFSNISYMRFSNLKSSVFSKDKIPIACCRGLNWPLAGSIELPQLAKTGRCANVKQLADIQPPHKRRSFISSCPTAPKGTNTSFPGHPSIHSWGHCWAVPSSLHLAIALQDQSSCGGLILPSQCCGASSCHWQVSLASLEFCRIIRELAGI